MTIQSINKLFLHIFQEDPVKINPQKYRIFFASTPNLFS